MTKFADLLFGRKSKKPVPDLSEAWCGDVQHSAVKLPLDEDIPGLLEAMRQAEQERLRKIRTQELSNELAQLLRQLR